MACGCRFVVVPKNSNVLCCCGRGPRSDEVVKSSLQRLCSELLLNAARRQQERGFSTCTREATKAFLAIHFVSRFVVQKIKIDGRIRGIGEKNVPLICRTIMEKIKNVPPKKGS